MDPDRSTFCRDIGKFLLFIGDRCHFYLSGGGGEWETGAKQFRGLVACSAGAFHGRALNNKFSSRIEGG